MTKKINIIDFFVRVNLIEMSTVVAFQVVHWIKHYFVIKLLDGLR